MSDQADTHEDDGATQVSGFQSAPYVPPMPQTREDFAALLDNPSRPAERQSAPSMEQLNPHLFAQDAR